MISADNTFNNAFCDTPTLKMSHDQDDLHNHLIAQVHIKLDLPTVPADKKAPANPDAYYLEVLCTTSLHTTKSSKPAVMPEMLSSKWNIGLVKTQAGVRNMFIPSEQKVWKKAPHLKSSQIKRPLV